MSYHLLTNLFSQISQISQISDDVKSYNDSSLIAKLDKLQKQYKDLENQMVSSYILTFIDNSLCDIGKVGNDVGERGWSGTEEDKNFQTVAFHTFNLHKQTLLEKMHGEMYTANVIIIDEYQNMSRLCWLCCQKVGLSWSAMHYSADVHGTFPSLAYVHRTFLVFPSSQLYRQLAWLHVLQDASDFARHNTIKQPDIIVRVYQFARSKLQWLLAISCWL